MSPAGSSRGSEAIWRTTVLFAGLVTLVALIAWPSFMGRIQYARTRAELAAIADAAAGARLAPVAKLFTTLARLIGPSVVNVTADRRLASIADEIAALHGESPQGISDESVGSGVIVGSDGVIVTNYHVVARADRISVRLADGREFPARLIGADAGTDVAVLEIDAEGLPAATWGDSDGLEVGEMVWAIGNPFGLDRTLTYGIISAVGRRGVTGDPLQEFLQTDAAINPGNSGGPLVNLRGEVIGINTAILSRTGASAGIGFAIPLSLAKPVVESIIESGSVRRGFLGAQVGDVNAELKDKFSLSVDTGAFISTVVDGQPAAKAGLQPGDVVISMDGKPVTSGTQLRNYIASRKPGSIVKMQVNRSGKEMEFSVNLQERTNEAMASFNGGPGQSLIGATLEPLTPEKARDLELSGPAVGLVVTKVEDEGLAAQANILPGDVIEEASGEALTSVEQFNTILKTAKDSGRGLRLVIRRGNVRMILVLR